MHLCTTSAPRQFAFLSNDEALFLESAFSRLLPERDHDTWRISPGAAQFVDEHVQSGNDCLLQVAIDLGMGELRLAGAQVASAYRGGIAAVQRHCLARYGKAFQDLPPPQQHLVLDLLERGAPSAGLRHHAVLFSLLLQHAAEAYFHATHVTRVRSERVAFHEWSVTSRTPLRG
jgi:gluconate 2-dehydrogenase gamma chain